MKKLLSVLFLTLITLTLTVSAEEVSTGEIFIELPSRIVSRSEFSVSPLLRSASASIYDTIEAGLIAQQDSIDISDHNYYIELIDGKSYIPQELSDIFYSVVYNLPQYGNLRTAFSVWYNTSSRKISAISPSYLTGYDEAAYRKAVDYAFSKAVSPDMSDIEKLLSIHDYLADAITYSSPVSLPDGSTDYPDSSYTPYGALVNRDAVCQGYSLAFKLLCDRAGIDCGYAVSTVESHMWNIVGLDDNYYHVDVTHDDPTGTYVNNVLVNVDRTTHRYFLTSDDDAVALRGYTGYNWTSDRPACTDSGLHGSLAYSSVSAPIIWRGGTFWYKEYGFYLNGNDIVYIPTGKLYKYLNGSFVSVSEEDYFPDNQLECEMFNLIGGKLAIDGPASASADLYIATYAADGKLSSLNKADITFDEKGRGVASVSGSPSKIMLFSDGGQTPLAYAAE